MDENLAAQAELALERQGEYDSLCYEGQWHTNGQLAERAARLATGFAELGVRPGDRLLVLMANCPEVPITYTAARRAPPVQGRPADAREPLPACTGPTRPRPS